MAGNIDVQPSNDLFVDSLLEIKILRGTPYLLVEL